MELFERARSILSGRVCKRPWVWFPALQKYEKVSFLCGMHISFDFLIVLKWWDVKEVFKRPAGWLYRRWPSKELSLSPAVLFGAASLPVIGSVPSTQFLTVLPVERGAGAAGQHFCLLTTEKFAQIQLLNFSLLTVHYNQLWYLYTWLLLNRRKNRAYIRYYSTEPPKRHKNDFTACAWVYSVK